MEKNKIKPGQNGLPLKKDEYTIEEKILLVSKAAEVGTHVVADAYEMDWHKIASWKKYYAGNIKFKISSNYNKKHKSSVKKHAEPVLIIQSQNGQETTAEELKAKIGAVDKIYIRVDEGKAYWVRGQETGSINLW